MGHVIPLIHGPDNAQTKAMTTIRHVLISLLLLLPVTATGQEVDCRVIGVKDGDTLVCLTAEKLQLTIRLAEIDAPESRQDYGNRSKQALSKMVFGKTVSVEVQTTDKYGRSVGMIKVDGRNVNLALVDQGMAWCYRKYLKDVSCLALEESAKEKALGLWAAPYAPIPPWEFRHGAKPTPPHKPSAPQTSLESPSKDLAGLTCGDKRVCRQMSSCAEAQFYLNQCGLARLDGDHDGVACDRDCQ